MVTTPSSGSFPQHVSPLSLLLPPLLLSRDRHTAARGYGHPHGIYNSQDQEAPKCPQYNEQIKKAMIHLHIRIPLGREKEGKVTLCDGVDRPGEHYAEWSKPVRGRQGPYDFTRVWNLIRKNKLANKIETGSQVFPLLYTGERGKTHQERSGG